MISFFLGQSERKAFAMLQDKLYFRLYTLQKEELIYFTIDKSQTNFIFFFLFFMDMLVSIDDTFSQ